MAVVCVRRRVPGLGRVAQRAGVREAQRERTGIQGRTARFELQRRQLPGRGGRPRVPVRRNAHEAQLGVQTVRRQMQPPAQHQPRPHPRADRHEHELGRALACARRELAPRGGPRVVQRRARQAQPRAQPLRQGNIHPAGERVGGRGRHAPPRHRARAGHAHRPSPRRQGPRQLQRRRDHRVRRGRAGRAGLHAVQHPPALHERRAQARPPDIQGQHGSRRQQGKGVGGAVSQGAGHARILAPGAHARSVRASARPGPSGPPPGRP